MSSLVCLDLENNNIGRLPPELSLIPNLRTLLVMGNTFKIPRADVLAKGSAEVIAWLKNKVPQPWTAVGGYVYDRPISDSFVFLILSVDTFVFELLSSPGIGLLIKVISKCRDEVIGLAKHIL